MSTTPPVPPPLRTNEPEPAPAPASRPPRSATPLECGFCKSQLTITGDFITLSDVAREYRDQKEKHAKAIEVLNDEISSLRAQITAKDAEIATLKGSAAAPKRSGLLIR